MNLSDDRPGPDDTTAPSRALFSRPNSNLENFDGAFDVSFVFVRGGSHYGCQVRLRGRTFVKDEVEVYLDIQLKNIQNVVFV